MIKISKDGVFFELTEIDEDDNKIVKVFDVLSTNMGIVSYLTFPVTIEPGVTVEDILNILEINIESTDFIFDSSLGGHSFSKFLDEIELDSPQDPMLKWMEIAHETDTLTTDDNELHTVPRMRGIGVNHDIFSVEFSKISTYKKIEIKLNTDFVVAKMNVLGEEEIVLSCVKSFTLFEVIHAILFEISFYGNPNEREEALREILESFDVDKIDAFKIKNRDDIERLKKELQQYIDKEDYEEAAKIRDKIKRLLEE